MATATKKRKEKKKLTLGRPALVAGHTTNLKQSILRLSISIQEIHFEEKVTSSLKKN
jgi:hypothetical protein